jgi:carbon catabolite-derepressing protein kinase
MEVMLEIYKSLSSLGMEWKSKEDIAWPEIGRRPVGGSYTEEVEVVLDNYREINGEDARMGRPRPDKKAEAAEEKAAQNLFVVETRHRYGNVMVRRTLSFLAVSPI